MKGTNKNEGKHILKISCLREHLYKMAEAGYFYQNQSRQQGMHNILFFTIFFLFTSVIVNAQNCSIKWILEQETATWQPRDSQGEVVHNGYMWILGGWSGNPYKNWDDIWYSKNGKDWKELKTKGLKWKERHEHSAFVFQDKIWIVGGMTPPLINDVWSLILPEDW